MSYHYKNCQLCKKPLEQEAVLTFANLLHNCIFHPLMPLAELLADTPFRAFSIWVWTRHEESRDDLRNFEKWYAKSEPPAVRTEKENK